MRARRLRKVVTALLPVVFFAAVAWLLRDELAELEVEKIIESLRQISALQLVSSAVLAVAAYGVLATLDVLARGYVGHGVSLRSTIAISFVSYAFNFNIGGIAGAVGFRYRLYSRRGLRPAVIAAITLFAVLATWSGWLLLLGASLALRPTVVPAAWGLGLGPGLLRAVGAVLLLMPALYLWACASHRRQLRIGRWRYRFPSLPRALAQVSFGTLYWLLPSAVIWMLQPRTGNADYGTILVSYLLSAMAGLILHVPAGLGVFEAVFLQTLGHVLDAGQILAMLLAYRGVYLLAPLATAAVLALLLEWRASRLAAALKTSPPDSRPPASRESLRPSR